MTPRLIYRDGFLFLYRIKAILYQPYDLVALKTGKKDLKSTSSTLAETIQISDETVLCHFKKPRCVKQTI
jgi:hypothetical protein